MATRTTRHKGRRLAPARKRGGPSRKPAPAGVAHAGPWKSFRAFLATYPGVAVDELIRGAGLDPEDLGKPDKLVALRSIVAMLEAAAEATGDEALAVRFGMHAPWGDIGVLAYVAFHSPTYGAAVANAIRYFAVQQTAGGVMLEVHGTTARIIYTIDDPSVGPHGQESMLVLYLFARVGHEVVDTGTKRGWAPRELQLRQRAPSRAAQKMITQAVRCPVVWGAEADALVMDAADLRLPMRTADPQLLPILLAHAEATLPRSDDFVSSVRRFVIAGIAGGDVSANAIAERMGLGPRSLQRRLQTMGRSFTEIVDEARLALARRYLDDRSLTLTEAAFLLGFSDLSAFSRAFRRWTGKSPVAYRRAR
ncbi:MAG: AraC family transcriptional regulator [Kofleriaceae bacterium]|nr:AraC family transcriptional regulator [Kofleriaceae bacterium]